MNLILRLQSNLNKATRVACTLLLVALFIGSSPFAAIGQNSGGNARLASSKSLNAITGSVKDAAGAALAGVSVVIKGTKTGTATNAEGQFVIEAKAEDVLRFSFIGFKTSDINIGNKSSINVVLEEDEAALDEVVVVGYAQQKKIHLTGAVAQIDMKSVEDLPVGSLSAALVSQQPGVGVSGGTNRPGDAAQITIRNPSLLSKDGGSLRPLYVIDNVIRSEDDFNTLDASEVENISILKDAAAAIYGARGGFGVVVVTTKKGKNSPPKFSYSTSYGTSNADLPKMMNGYELATYTNNYNFVGGKKATDVNSLIYTQDELDHYKANSQDWLSMAWKPSNVVRHALNVSGGSEKATYFAGITYNKQDANFDNINFNKWTFRASTEVKVTKGLKASLGVAGDLSQKKMYFLKQGGETSERDFSSLLYQAPFKPAYIDGYPVNTYTGGGSNSIENFHFFEAQKSNNYTTSRNNGLNINASIDYEIPFLKGLKARATFNKNFENNWGKQFGTFYNVYTFNMLGTNKHIYGGGVKSVAAMNNGDRVRLNPSYSDGYQLNGYLTYEKAIGKHNISAIALFEQAETYSDGTSAMIEKLVSGAQDNIGFGLGGTAAGAGVGTVTESESESGRLSYASRLNYAYADKYLMEFSLRRDASTNFAPENRWGTFPALSLGWVLSEESFFKNSVRWIDLLKIRASAGHSGMDNTRAYNWLKSYNLIQTGNGPVFGGNLDRAGILRLKNAMANESLRWDDNTKLNAGIDAGFFGNKLNLSVDAFFDKRYNMLTSITSSVPLTVGATLPSENFATINSFGTEISLGWSNKINNDWSYKINGFLSWSDNKQVKVDFDKGLKGTIYDPTNQSTDQGVLGLRSLGILRTQAEVDALLAKNPNYTVYGLKPAVGMLYYEDLYGAKSTTADENGNYSYGAPDGKIDDNDRTYLTKKKDNHYGFGLNFSTSYRKLTLSVNAGGSFGGQALIESGARGWNTSAQVSAITNLPIILNDHWTAENTEAKYPSPFYRSQNQVDSDFWFASSFQMAIRTLNLSYELPSKIAQRLRIGNPRVYITSTNPLNVYKAFNYKNYAGSYDAYPVLRSFSVGLNLNL